MPSTIEALHREYASRGLVVLAINLGEARAQVLAWARREGVATRILLDSTLAVARAYRVEFTPTVFLVGRDGGLVAKSVGVRDWLGDRGRALFKRLLEPAP